MKQIQETKNLLLFQKITGNRKEIYRQHKEDEKQEKVYIYTIYDDRIEYPFEGNVVKKIVLQGFTELPSELIPYGYGFQEKSLNNFFRYGFDDKRINQIILTESLDSKRDKKSLILNLTDLQELITSINQEQRACTDTKKILIKNYIVDTFPEVNLDHTETNNNKSLILRNLNDKLIEKLNASEIEQIGDFYVKATRKFKAGHIIKRMSTGLLKNAQLITLQEIIAKYEEHLKNNPPESTWQSFFDEYITLFDSRYVRKLNYKNIATGLTKYPDLVLVDIYGYLDFYELKKSGTKLLQYDSSHKTWYWSKEVSMVISQASDYLQKARENALSYSKTIKSETETETEEGITVSIINPRAIIVIGSNKELNSEKKKNQFKNLRESLKDIEFVLYDELLDRLKNLLDTIKIENKTA